MKRVELYTTEGCTLCAKTLDILKRLQTEMPFELIETVLTDHHPKYQQYLVAVPVVVINGERELVSSISEEQLREALDMVYRPTPKFFVAKFLEALGFLTVFVGFIYGLAGDMWTNLYFFLGGIVVFAVGRIMEQQEVRRHRRYLRQREEAATPRKEPADG
jgi:glutaredoxin